MENLIQLADSMRQASVLLADEDTEDAPRQTACFLGVVALGNVGAGKSAVLNSLIGHPVLPTGENGATRAPIVIDMERDESVTSRGLVVQIENKTQQVSASAIRHSLQDKLSKAIMSSSGRGRPEEISLKLRSSTAPPLKLIDLPGLDQRAADDSMVNEYTEHGDAILLVVVPAVQAPEISSSRGLRMAHNLDPDGSRTVGVISKVDQAASDPRCLAAVQALLVGQGPSITLDVPWVALIGQSVSIAAAHAGSVGADNTLETAWRAEMESLKSILSSAPQTKLGRNALMDTLSRQIRKRLKLRLPSILSGLEGRTQVVEEELVRLGEQLVQTSEGTRAIALELCREFEDKFLQHINTGEGGSWKVVSSFEGALPNRIKQLPLNDIFELSSVKKVVLEADGYQPYLISPEKGLRALVRKVLELAKDPARQCVDEVHRILIDIISSAASATPGLGRFPPFKREVVSIATAALDEYRAESKKMVVALVDMERAFIPPQHFIRLVQRRLDRQRREDEQKQRSSRKAQEAEQSLLNRSTTPPPQTGGSLKSMKDKGSSDKDAKETSSLQSAGPAGELTAGYLLKRSSKTNGWSKRWFVLNEKTGKLGYTKNSDEKLFRGIINLEECIVEEVTDKDDVDEAPPSKSKSSKRANGPEKGPSLAFKLSNKVSYKTVVKAHHAIILKAENMTEKTEWMSKLSSTAQGSKGVPSAKGSSNETGPTMRTSLSEGSLDTAVRRPVDPDEDLRLMAQEARDYVEAVLNSLAANVPKAVVLCQVERAKDAMLNQLYSSISAQSNERVQELLQEDQDVKKRRERYTRQASLLSRLTRQLSVHEARAATTSGWSANGVVPTSSGRPAKEEWRSAFEEAGADGYRGSLDQNIISDRSNGGHSRRFSDPEQNGDVSSSKRTPSRLPPPPPSSGGAGVYRY